MRLHCSLHRIHSCKEVKPGKENMLSRSFWTRSHCSTTFLFKALSTYQLCSISQNNANTCWPLTAHSRSHSCHRRWWRTAIWTLSNQPGFTQSMSGKRCFPISPTPSSPEHFSVRTHAGVGGQTHTHTFYKLDTKRRGKSHRHIFFFWFIISPFKQ